MKVKIALYFTTSKFAAYLILAIGTTFAFINKDASTLLATFSAVSAILIMKTYVTGRTEQHRMNNQNDDYTNRPNDYNHQKPYDEVG